MSLASSAASASGQSYATLTDESTITTDATLTVTAGDSSSDAYSTATVGTVWASTTTIGTMTTSASASQPAIQTRPFTGQALLVGTCALPQFTILTFPDGGSIEVPLIGCSDDRPDCCPSLGVTSPARAAGTESNAPTASGGSTTSPTPKGVVSMLSKYPLTVCPSDMVDLDPVCCPVGFSHYGQNIIGNLPCYSTLTTTIYSPDASVLASITSVVAASMASASTTTTPTISVIVNQVFALGLPCAEDDEDSGGHSGLSTGAKAGIGAGAGVGALLIIFAIVACCLIANRRRKKRKQRQDPTTTGSELPVPEMVAGSGAGAPDAKHLSAATTMTPGSPIMYPQPQTQPQMSQHMTSPYPGAMGGNPQSHGYSPAFGHHQPGPPPQMGPDQYGGMYNMQPTTSHPYPYQYHSPSLPPGQQPGMPYSPTYNQMPSAPPLQFYSYQNPHHPQMNTSDPTQYQYQQQYQQQQQQAAMNPHASMPVEADSGSSKFQPSSLSASQPGLSTMTTPPLSHDRNSASQPTGSATGARSVAELSSHGGSSQTQSQSQSQSQRHLISRKSVLG